MLVTTQFSEDSVGMGVGGHRRSGGATRREQEDGEEGRMDGATACRDNVNQRFRCVRWRFQLGVSYVAPTLTAVARFADGTQFKDQQRSQRCKNVLWLRVSQVEHDSATETALDNANMYVSVGRGGGYFLFAFLSDVTIEPRIPSETEHRSYS